ncbi:class I SAM-dependent methyltransferase [Candidatus Methylospira mobilis]|uniref:Class I SAM-dependent methyltransferase n=2 Tax=Candidatus Methylospira mobilis TaxID=1808979 RepID=A0A5Q0BLV0_9GAMM|nr:class I SAM-dependent methyltransferase [Candidatus Methylospira mobilis]QFY43201.1 class I SAM-dependent methyltransferase [Candidatus Methylospira mobilis]WNV03593.1 class I SAM-dependent methyltransferase [Candidatus Methylospira mobilis]
MMFFRQVPEYRSGQRFNQSLNTMKTTLDNDELRNPRQRFLRWYRSTPAGESLQACEDSLICAMLKGTYNERILQVESLVSLPCAARNELYARIILFKKDRAPYNNTHPQQVQGEMTGLPFADDSMDKVILPHVVEFEHTPEAIVAECVRVLKPEGELIIFAFNPWHLKALRLLFSCANTQYPHHTIQRSLLEKWLHLQECKTTLAAGLNLATPCRVIETKTWRGRIRAQFSAVYALRAQKKRLSPINPHPVTTSYADILPGCMPEISLLRKN